LAPSFTVSPEAPQEGQLVFFDASASEPSDGIVSYSWDFGDRRGGSGRTRTHEYEIAGPYHVTLTIADQFGRKASTTRTIEVGASQSPTATFVFSPTEPAVNQNIAFNASGSTAAAGREIVKYTWDFGAGAGPQAGNATINHKYVAVGTYNVTLKVTDDAGKTATVTVAVTVLP
jgi:PKD repeat protein